MTAALVAQQPGILNSRPLDSNSASQNIPIGKIAPSKTNRRAEVDEEFVQSIRQHGVLEPVLVRQVKADAIHVSQSSAIFRPIDIPRSFAVGDLIYEIVCGERRFRAAIEARLSTIPAVVRTLSDAQAMELQIVENDQRENLTAMDRAEAYSRLRAQYLAAHVKDKGYSETMAMQEIAQKVNREVRTVQQIIALGKLSRECQEAMRKGEMEASHGYELCRRDEAEQLELLKWLRRETLHGQGDIPSVRRLKREIAEMDRIAGAATTQTPTIDDAEYQSAVKHVRETGEKVRYVTNGLLQGRLKIGHIVADRLLVRMWKEGIIGTEDQRGHWAYIFPKTAQLTFDGKTIDLTPGPLPGSVRTALLKVYPDLSTTAHFLKDGRVQLALGLTGKPFYMTVYELQKLLGAKALHAPAQTSAPEVRTVRAGFAGTREIAAPKAPTKAQEKEAVENEKKRRAAEAKKQEAQKLTVENERQVRLLAVDAIAKKAKLNRPLIDLVVIECLKNGNEEIAQFAERVLGWPKPKPNRAGYSYSEIEKLAIARVPELKPAQLAGLLAVSLMADDMFVYPGGVRECKKIDAMAKEHKVNIGKIRKDLIAASKLKAKSQKPKAGVPS